MYYTNYNETILYAEKVNKKEISADGQKIFKGNQDKVQELKKKLTNEYNDFVDNKIIQNKTEKAVETAKVKFEKKLAAQINCNSKFLCLCQVGILNLIKLDA